MIVVVVQEPGKEPEKRAVENRLEALQAIVGGLIEVVTVQAWALRGFDVIVNEEGKLAELPFNRRLEHHTIVGTLLVSKHDPEGKQISLTEEEAEHVCETLREMKR